MLETLYVKDFAIVDQAEISFRPGLTVVTGETGAGKSLMVDALLLLAGGRADASVIRHGCERTELSAAFHLGSRPDVQAWLKTEDLDDEGQCQIRRVIRSEGNSRAWINGRPVTLTQLSALGKQIIEIHGQHEHQALLNRAQQLTLLDAFGTHAPELAEVYRLTQQWRDVMTGIAELSRGENHDERIAWLEHQVIELDQHAVTADELVTLEETHRRLANAGQLLEGCSALSELLNGDTELTVLALVARAQAESARLMILDPRVAGTHELLAATYIQVTEASNSLTRYQTELDLDPNRLAEIEIQLGKLYELARKHRVPMSELKPLTETLRNELETLRCAEVHLAQLEAERNRLVNEYFRAAKVLSTRRMQTRQHLATIVTTLMTELGMAGGSFDIAMESTHHDEPDTQGAERCEFLVSANPGQPPRPLRKVASGGELSRISLAIEVATLGLDTVGTMVFDEVDSGIGGAVAEIVGQKLRRLGEARQVLCVTHLPQVAALGHQHLCVAKSTSGGRTEMTIEMLDEKSRREEVARMLGGIQITRETLAHAKQMLAWTQVS